MDKITICVGFPILSKLVRGNSVELSNCVLIPDDQLFNESKDDSCCIRYDAKTGAIEPAAQSGEAPVQQLKPAISLVLSCAERLFTEAGEYDTLERFCNLLAKRAGI